MHSLLTKKAPDQVDIPESGAFVFLGDGPVLYEKPGPRRGLTEGAKRAAVGGGGLARLVQEG